MHYLTKQDLLDLHACAVERYGGRLGIASQDGLTRVADAPRQAMFGAELYVDLPAKASALVFLLIKSRPFLGANETTALLALMRFLAINDVPLDPTVSDTELLWLVRAINAGDLDREGLETWLRQNMSNTTP